MKYNVLDYYRIEIEDVEGKDGTDIEVTQIWFKVNVEGEEKNLYIYREEYFDEEGDGKGDSIEVGLSKIFKDKYSFVEREGEWVDEKHPIYKVYLDIMEKLEDKYGDCWDIWSYDDSVNNIEGEV